MARIQPFYEPPERLGPDVVPVDYALSAGILSYDDWEQMQAEQRARERERLYGATLPSVFDEPGVLTRGNEMGQPYYGYSPVNPTRAALGLRSQRLGLVQGPATNEGVLPGMGAYSPQPEYDPGTYDPEPYAPFVKGESLPQAALRLLRVGGEAAPPIPAIPNVAMGPAASALGRLSIGLVGGDVIEYGPAIARGAADVAGRGAKAFQEGVQAAAESPAGQRLGTATARGLGDVLGASSLVPRVGDDVVAAGMPARPPRGQLNASSAGEPPGVPPGKPPVPPGGTPPVPPGGTREAVERGFAENMRTSPRTGPELVNRLTTDPITYEPRPTQPLSDWAREVVTADPMVAAARILDAQRITDKEVALASHLAPVYDTLDVGKREIVLSALTKASAGLTEAGQTAQAASIYNHLSPEGILDYSIRLIRNAERGGANRGAITRRMSSVLQEQANADLRLTQQELDLLNKFRKAGDLEQAARQLLKLNERVMRAEDLIGALTDGGQVKLDDLTSEALGRLHQLKQQLREYNLARVAEGRAAGAQERLASEGITDLADETAAIRERIGPLQDQLRDLRAAQRAEQRVAGEQERLAAQGVDDIEAAAAAARERAASVNAQLTDYARAVQGEARAAEKMGALERQGITMEDLPELAKAARERAAQVSAEVNAYNRARQAMIEAEALKLRLDNLVQSGVAESSQEIYERTALSRAYTAAYNRARQAMVDAEAKALRLEGRIAAGAAPDLPTITRQWSDATRRLAELRQYQRDLAYLTDATARVVKKRAVDVTRETINRARRMVREADVVLPDELARSFLDRAKKLRGMADDDPQRYIEQKALMHDIAAMIPPSKWQNVLAVWNLSRDIMASFDFSMPLRQGVLAIGSPGWWKSWGPMFRAAASEDNAKWIDAVIHTRPNAKRAEQAGLYLSELGGGLTRGEELFTSKLLNNKVIVGGRDINIPGRLRTASERNAVTFLNKLRSDMFDDLVGRIEGKWGQELSEQDLKDIAQYVNWATGRGTLAPNPNIDRALATVASHAFFSPRNWASRFEAPIAGLRAFLSLVPGAEKLPGHIAYSRPVAVALAQEAAKTAAILTSVLAIGKTALQLFGTEGDVETDPRSPDFAKLRIGPLRVDLLGGEQQNFRYLAQILAGQRKTSSGKVIDAERDAAIGQFIRSKLHPTLGEGWDTITGRDFMGRPQTVEGAITGLLTPMVAQSLKEAYDVGGAPVAAVTAPLTVFGAGTNVYETTRDIQDKIAREQGATDWEHLTPEQQRAAKQDPRYTKAIDEIRMSAAPLSDKDVQQAAREFYDTGKQKLVEDVAQRLDTLNPVGVRKAFSQLNHDLRIAAEVTLNSIKVKEAEGQKVEPKTWQRAFLDKYLAIQPVDKPDGTPDYAAFAAARQQVIDEAAQYGIKPEYFLERGPDKGLDLPDYGNARVNEKYREVYEMQRVLRPYWELEAKLIKQYPALRDLQQRADKALAAGNQQLAQSYSGMLDEMLTPLKLQYRMKHPEADALLVRWYGLKPVTSAGMAALKQ